MKRIFGFNLLLLIFTLCSCKDKHGETIGPARVTLSLHAADISYPDNGRVLHTIDDARAVLVGLETASGEFVHEMKLLNLFKFNDSFVSEELQLQPGAYRIAKFFVTDENNNVIYASPYEGSELAYLVEHPLPIEFEVSESEIRELVIEVVCTDEHQPEDFGYVAFVLSPVDTKAYNVTVTVADEDNEQPPSGTLEIIAKNNDDEIQWRHSMEIIEQGIVRIPVGYNKYSFILSRPGYITHSQHYRFSDIESLDKMFFELIPEGSGDFYVQHLLEGKVTIYYPVDRAKLYTRIDLAEDLRLEYLWIDKDFSDVLGVPLGLLQLREHFDAKLQHAAINLFDNVPYNQAPDQRDRVEMDPEHHLTDFDRDVLITSFLIFDYSDDYAAYNFDWFFDKQPFFDYWCSAFNYLCEEEMNSASRPLKNERRNSIIKDMAGKYNQRGTIN